MTIRLPPNGLARVRRFVVIALGIAGASACRKEGPPPRPSELEQTASPTPLATAPSRAPQTGNDAAATTAGTARSDEAIYRPKTVDGKKLPFILWLHGLGASGALMRTVLQLDKLSEHYQFAYAAPDGAVDSKQRKFWNANEVCCDFDHQGVDHVARLRALLDRAKTQPNIDPHRVYVIGFSNGGFMAHRLACSGVDLAGIASMAGLGPSPTDPCTPAHPMRILEIHGANDVVVRPEGGRLFDDAHLPAHPALRTTVDAWAKRNHCDTSAPSSKTVDLVPNLPGAETTQLAYSGCAASVELWMIAGAGHMSVNAIGVVGAAVEHLLSP